jgi:AcrR family transcriptional regulator
MATNVETGTIRERRTQAERSAATTGDLVRTARELFASRGFADTSIDDIVSTAGVTRGALYHHFDSKTDVFRAVFEDLERELAERITNAARGKRDPWKRIEAGCMVFLDACREQDVQRIVMLDAPAVLGWDEYREIEHRYTLTLWHHALQAAMDDGKLSRRPVEPLAHLLFGSVCEAAMITARGSDAALERDMRKEIRRLLAALARS